MKKVIILLVVLSVSIFARNIYDYGRYHPKSEPRGLYIVDFSYSGYNYSYRIYCPNGDVRNITRGKWGKARKAYMEDKVKFRSLRVVREAFDYTCE